MAKQVGIHQIRGKVDGRSYYRQSGVADGLSRSINQGLSDRVKNSAEYANTRLNNAEFKRANRLATIAFRSIYPSWRSMYRRFAVAYMTKRFLELVKGGTGSWGLRYPLVELGGTFEDVLLHYAKNGEYQDQYGHITKEFSTDTANIGGQTFSQNVPEMEIHVSRAESAPIVAQGIDGLNVYSRTVFVSCDTEPHVAMSIPVKNTGIYPVGEDDSPLQIPITGKLLDDASVVAPTPVKTMISQAPNAGVYTVFVMVPFRIVGDKQFELQELATYDILGAALKSA